jgi:hypothetical protein
VPTPHASGRRGRTNRHAARPPHSGCRMSRSGTRPPRWAALSLHRRGAQLHAASDSRALAPGRRQGRGGCGTLDTRRPNSNCEGLRPPRQCCTPDCRYKARLSGARVQRKKTWAALAAGSVMGARAATFCRAARRGASLRFGQRARRWCASLRFPRVILLARSRARRRPDTRHGGDDGAAGAMAATPRSCSRLERTEGSAEPLGA